MSNLLRAAAIAASLTAAMPTLHAAELDIRIVNLTNGIYFTPVLATAHRDDIRLFAVGEPASTNLRAMAEGGDVAGLLSDLEAASATIMLRLPDAERNPFGRPFDLPPITSTPTFVRDPADGVLGPADDVEFSLDTGVANYRLSVVAMVLPSNDAFVGLDSAPIPTAPGVYVFELPAYDAGTEANDELMAGADGGMPGTPGIPGDPGDNVGAGGMGVATADANPNVHVHRGTVGDTDPVGGVSDLDNRVHRWLNPVARVIVTVKSGGAR